MSTDINVGAVSPTMFGLQETVIASVPKSRSCSHFFPWATLDTVVDFRLPKISVHIIPIAREYCIARLTAMELHNKHELPIIVM